MFFDVPFLDAILIIENFAKKWHYLSFLFEVQKFGNKFQSLCSASYNTLKENLNKILFVFYFRLSHQISSFYKLGFIQEKAPCGEVVWYHHAGSAGLA